MPANLYPDATGKPFVDRVVGGVLKLFRRSDATEFYSIDGANKRVLINDTVRQLRQRVAIADINTGLTLLAALPGYKYRLVDAYAIAIGGAAGSVTSVDILGTQTTAQKLVAFLVAGLTRSTVLRAGAATNGVVLADGASFVANDVNTAITIGKTGSSIDTATHVDICLSYIVEPA